MRPAKASPLGRGVTEGDGEGKPGRKEPLRSDRQALCQSDAIAVQELFISSLALSVSSPCSSPRPGCGSQRLLRCRSHPAGRCPNSSSLFPPLAAVVAVAPKGEPLAGRVTFLWTPEARRGAKGRALLQRTAASGQRSLSSCRWPRQRSTPVSGTLCFARLVEA